MDKIHVTSEINKLKKILLHRPGNELLNLTPNMLDTLLFDDILDLNKAVVEHDTFAKILVDHGVEVVYLEDLMTETLQYNPHLKKQFISDFISEASIINSKDSTLVCDYLMNISDFKQLVLKTMAGITVNELNKYFNSNIVSQDCDSHLVVNPMPNLYFTRDPFVSIGNNISINKMYAQTRQRETIYSDYIFRFHPLFKETVTNLYGRNQKYHIEGGDILNINETLLFIGISQRTTIEAIQELAHNIFFEDNTNKIKTILAFSIPKARAYMHLDTVLTQIDYDAFVIHPNIINNMQVFEIVPNHQNKTLNVTKIDGELNQIIAKYMKLKQVRLFPCGGGDMLVADREQWSDGANTLAIDAKKSLFIKEIT